MPPTPRRLRVAALATSLALALGAATVAHAQAADSAALARRARQIAALLTPGAFAAASLDTIFAPSLLRQATPAQLAPLFAQGASACGRATSVAHVGTVAPGAERFRVMCSAGVAIGITIGVSAAPASLVETFYIQPAAKIAMTLDDVVRQMRALHGHVTFELARIDGAKTTVLAAADSGMALGIGSAFKLYVLGELARSVRAGERHLADVVRLDSTRRALPTGILQTWPNGTPVTLQTLATLMISISDNTAADHLLHALGRERVERMQTLMGNGSAARNVPFLSVRELFSLKSSANVALRQRYAAGDAAARRALLPEVDRLPLPQQSTFGSAPIAIDTLEWYASAADLVRAMRWLRDNTASGASAPIRDVLAVNPGIALATDAWAYVGYKGGSEPGVLELTFLARTTDGRWYACAAAWNDPARDLDPSALLAIVQRALELAPDAPNMPNAPDAPNASHAP